MASSAINLNGQHAAGIEGLYGCKHAGTDANALQTGPQKLMQKAVMGFRREKVTAFIQSAMTYENTFFYMLGPLNQWSIQAS